MKVLLRIRPFFQLLVALGALTLLVNVALQSLTSARILTWPSRSMGGNGYLEDNRQRVAGALEEYNRGRIGSDEFLGAFVGISNLREDVDLKTVGDVAGGKWRFMGLGGAGFAMPDIAPHAQVLLASDLRPDVVVLGIGLHQLVDSRPKPGAFNPGFVEYVRRRDVRNVAIAIRDWAWFYSRRQDVAVSIESSVLDARDQLFRRFDVHLPESQASRNSPWREMIKADWPEHFSRNTLREQAEFFEGLGIFKAETYERSPKATSVLVKLMEDFRRRGATVVLLLMPLHSEMVRRIPAAAFETLSANLQRAFASDPLPVIDMRTAIGDEGFVDLPHLNRKGSAKFSQIMAERLRPFLPSTSPLMKGARESKIAALAQGRR